MCGNLIVSKGSLYVYLFELNLRNLLYVINLFQPQAFLNGDKYIPEVFQRQGAHRYVDCRSAKILSRNNGQTIVQYDMIVTSSTGQPSRQQCIVGLLTGKGYLVQYQADDGSWHSMDRTTASLAGYNAGLVLIDYLQL